MGSCSNPRGAGIQGPPAVIIGRSPPRASPEPNIAPPIRGNKKAVSPDIRIAHSDILLLQSF
jgi:hypothetical protein